MPDASLVAVGSRTREKAMAFGSQFNVTYRHASYEELVNNPAVDAVYVATPHSLHAANTIMALQAGKPVLCEKPFAINAHEAEEMVLTARAKKLLLMEAMWTRFLPVMIKLRRLLADGAIGEVRMLAADFGFLAGEEEGRLVDPALGGGALLDIGVYPISLASMIFGKPSDICGLAKLGRTGVDKQNGIVMMYPQGQIAVLHSSIEATTFQEATIMGSKARIKIHSAWWKATAMTLMRENNKNDFIESPYIGNGYQYEVAEFMRCLREKKLESEIMSLDETVSIMRTMDSLRQQWGLRYPGE